MGLWSWAKTAAGNLADSAVSLTKAETWSNAWDKAELGTLTALGKVGDGIQWTFDKAGQGLAATGNGIKWVYDNPEKAMEGTLAGLETAAAEVGGFAEFAYNDPWRTLELAGQGITNGVVSTVGMVGDLGEAVLWNNTTRHLVNLGVGIGNLGMEEGDKMALLKKHEHTYSQALENKCHWARELSPVNPDGTINENLKYERVVLYGSQAVFEAGTFVAIGVATAGTGAAAYTALRGGAYAQRALSVAEGVDKLVKAGRIPKLFGEAMKVTSSLEPVVGERVAGGLTRGVLSGVKAYKWAMPYSGHAAILNVPRLGGIAVGIELAGGGISFGGNTMKNVQDAGIVLVMNDESNAGLDAMMDKELGLEKAPPKDITATVTGDSTPPITINLGQQFTTNALPGFLPAYQLGVLTSGQKMSDNTLQLMPLRGQFTANAGGLSTNSFNGGFVSPYTSTGTNALSGTFEIKALGVTPEATPDSGTNVNKVKISMEPAKN